GGGGEGRVVIGLGDVDGGGGRIAGVALDLQRKILLQGAGHDLFKGQHGFRGGGGFLSEDGQGKEQGESGGAERAGHGQSGENLRQIHRTPTIVAEFQGWGDFSDSGPTGKAWTTPNRDRGRWRMAFGWTVRSADGWRQKER